MVDVKSEVYYINHDPVLGWMSPDGQLIECSYAEHEMAAKDIVQISGWLDDDVPHTSLDPTKVVRGSCGLRRIYFSDFCISGNHPNLSSQSGTSVDFFQKKRRNHLFFSHHRAC